MWGFFKAQSIKDESAKDQEIAQLRAELDESQHQLHHYRAVGSCLANFSLSFSASQNSMGNMAELMKQETEQASESARISHHSQQVVHEMATQLLALAKSSGNSAQSVNQLHQLSQNITDMVELIQRISAQTHLLSMNAAVEAARAGSEGAGFAAVAKEVQRLSADTDQATKNIVPLVRAIQDESNGVRNHVSDLSSEAQRFSKNGSQMAVEMGQVAGLSECVQRAVQHSAMRSFVELAKIDHLIYKFEIYKVFFGVSEKRPNDLADHCTCRMGRWYYEGEGKRSFASLPGYRQLEAPHIRVHRHGREALVQLKQGNHESAVQDLQQMETASGDVVRCLEQMAEAHYSQMKASAADDEAKAKIKAHRMATATSAPSARRAAVETH